MFLWYNFAQAEGEQYLIGFAGCELLVFVIY